MRVRTWFEVLGLAVAVLVVGAPVPEAHAESSKQDTFKGGMAGCGEIYTSQLNDLLAGKEITKITSGNSLAQTFTPKGKLPIYQDSYWGESLTPGKASFGLPVTRNHVYFAEGTKWTAGLKTSRSNGNAYYDVLACGYQFSSPPANEPSYPTDFGKMKVVDTIGLGMEGASNTSLKLTHANPTKKIYWVVFVMPRSTLYGFTYEVSLYPAVK